MNQIIQQYRKRKSIYFALIAAMFGVIISFRIFSPSGEHPMNILELFQITILLLIIVSIFVVFKCPKCNKSLVFSFSSTWMDLHFCPKCGVELNSKMDR